jgi:hypothetical protein
VKNDFYKNDLPLSILLQPPEENKFNKNKNRIKGVFKKFLTTI